MATSIAHTNGALSGTRRRQRVPAASLREDVITMLLGIVALAGGATDDWAHTNRLSQIKPEGFFTPYHALLYTGLLSTSAWTIFLAYRRREYVQVWWRDAWPAGYKIGGLGSVMVVFGGMGDMIWHSVFGVETGLDAQLSPSHLCIFLGTVLVCSCPMRSWWASGEGGWRAVTGVFSMTFPATMGMHTFTFLSAFGSKAPTLPYIHDTNGPSEHAAVAGFNSYIVTTAMLMIPIMWSMRRRVTPGMAAGVFAIAAVFEMIRYDHRPPLLVAALLAIAGAGLADYVIMRIEAVRGPNATLRLPLYGFIIPAFAWSGHMLGLEIGSGIRWQAELWTGTLILCAALGALLGGLASQPVPQTTADEAFVPPAAARPRAAAVRR